MSDDKRVLRGSTFKIPFSDFSRIKCKINDVMGKPIRIDMIEPTEYNGQKYLKVFFHDHTDKLNKTMSIYFDDLRHWLISVHNNKLLPVDVVFFRIEELNTTSVRDATDDDFSPRKKLL